MIGDAHGRFQSSWLTTPERYWFERVSS